MFKIPILHLVQSNLWKPFLSVCTLFVLLVPVIHWALGDIPGPSTSTAISLWVHPLLTFASTLALGGLLSTFYALSALPISLGPHTLQFLCGISLDALSIELSTRFPLSQATLAFYTRIVGSVAVVFFVTSPFRMSDGSVKCSWGLSCCASLLPVVLACVGSLLISNQSGLWQNAMIGSLLSNAEVNRDVLILTMKATIVPFLSTFHSQSPSNLKKMILYYALFSLSNELLNTISPQPSQLKLTTSLLLSCFAYFSVLIGILSEIITSFHSQELTIEDLRKTMQKGILMSDDSKKEVIFSTKSELKKIRERDDILEKLGLEMRTVSSAIMGMLELLLDSKLGKQEREYVHSLEKTVNALTNLIENALEYSRAEAGRVEIDMTQSFRLEELLDGLLDDKLVRGKEDVEVSYEIDSSLPKVVIGDFKVIKRILNHLVHNAVKFTQQGEVKVIANLLQKNNDEIFLQVKVSDSGNGIPQKFLKFVFTPFYTLRETGCGTGLGLAICHRLARLLTRGSITLDSKIDQGTVVTLQCSLKEGYEGSPIIEEISTIGLGIILVVSYKKSISRTIPGMLERRGIKNVYVTDNSDSVERKIKQCDNYRIVLVDYVVYTETNERIECFEFVKKLSEIDSIVPIIMATEEQKESLSGFRCLTKPIRYESLMSTIKKAIPGISSSLPLTADTGTISKMALLKNRHILIAEDNVMMRSVLQKLIVGMGMRCTATKNGLECFQEYIKNKQEFDLIIMDCLMPTMTGFQASMKIREYEKQQKWKATPIVALTATKSDSIHQNCLSVGMNDCIIKPVRRQTLLEIFSKYVQNGEVVVQADNETNPKIEEVSKGETHSSCVLLVEDNLLVAKITQRVLIQSKYKVKHAIHGQEALAMITSNYHEYDVVLMDIMMPVMDGITCTKKIRQFELERGLDAKPIIALTANPMPGHKNECKLAGCTDYARKPIDYPSLKAIVSKYSHPPKQHNK